MSTWESGGMERERVLPDPLSACQSGARWRGEPIYGLCVETGHGVANRDSGCLFGVSVCDREGKPANEAAACALGRGTGSGRGGKALFQGRGRSPFASFALVI